MKFNPRGNTTFFRTVSKEAVEQEEGIAASMIQSWWKRVNLRHTANESKVYLKNFSLAKIQKEPISNLQKFIVDINTRKTTHKLLIHLEQAKDLILSQRTKEPTLRNPERIFLFAYLIVSDAHEMSIETKGIAQELKSQAAAMLKSFEELCKFMIDTYLSSVPSPPHSPLAERTPSYDQVFASMEQFQLHQTKEMMINDVRFRQKGKQYLDAFHRDQQSYYQTFQRHVSRQQIVGLYIKQFLKLENRRLEILHKPVPVDLKVYQEVCTQQENLRAEIEELMNSEGLEYLAKDLQTHREHWQANYWKDPKLETLVHEFALNPRFKIPVCWAIEPEQDIAAAISSLNQEMLDYNPMVMVIEEIIENLCLLASNNLELIEEFKAEFNKPNLVECIKNMGLQKGLYHIFFSIIEKIKVLEPFDLQKSTDFQKYLREVVKSKPNNESLLRETINFIYDKLYKIQTAKSECFINEARDKTPRQQHAYEQKKFEERLKDNQLTLRRASKWVHKIVSEPLNHHMEPRVLFSQYNDIYFLQALLLQILSQKKFDVATIPETFNLDHLRLLHWHARYQQIFYTALAMVQFNHFCTRHGLQLTAEEQHEQKKHFLYAFQDEFFTDPKAIAHYILGTVRLILSNKGKSLQDVEERAGQKIIEAICLRVHPIAGMLNKRLGDHLLFYFRNGRLLDVEDNHLKLYGLKYELGKLGEEMLSLLRLHAGVHGAWYRRSIEEHVWSPFFALFKEHNLAINLPLYTKPIEKPLNKLLHYLDKFVFLLAGLTLVKNALNILDTWNTHSPMDNANLKHFATSSGLLDMLNSPEITKDALAEKFIELMKHLTSERELPIDAQEEYKLQRLLNLAKTIPTLETLKFREEITEFCRKSVTHGENGEICREHLAFEFREEVAKLIVAITSMMSQIKQSQNPSDTEPLPPLIFSAMYAEHRLHP